MALSKTDRALTCQKLKRNLKKGTKTKMFNTISTKDQLMEPFDRCIGITDGLKVVAASVAFGFL